jgi:hypothetical protein
LLAEVHPSFARTSVPGGRCAIVINYLLPREDIEVAVRHSQPEGTIHVVGDEEVFEDILDKLWAI